MKKFFIIFGLLLIFCFLSAKPISFDISKKVATQWYLHNFNNQPVFAESYQNSYNDITVFYTFNFENGGFIILSADDNIYPILAFSYDEYAPSAISNPAVQSYIIGLKKTVANVIENHFNYPENRKIWARILSNDFSEFVHSSKDVAPIVTTKWDQDYPYNMYCPMINGQRTMTGCVATAMGQIMKANDYPEHGTGSHSYTWNGQTLSADFENTTYQWNLMPNHLYSTSPLNQRQAVATLLYHCGVATDMDYGVNGSGTYTSKAESALQLYFGYNPYTVQMRTRANYSDTDWINFLKTDLDDGFPVLYAGDDGNTGHAFVCDGYQGNNHFHFNWGWSGYYDGYFYLNNLNPMGYNFNQHQQAIFGIRPPEAPQPPQNLTALVLNRDVLLTWEAPSNKILTGYKIYRDGEMIEQFNNPESISYYDMQLSDGVHTYYVTAIYSNPDAESEPSNTVTVEIGTDTYNNTINEVTNKITNIWPIPFTSGSKNLLKLEYLLKQNAMVNIYIYNLKGEKVKNLVSKYQNKGKHQIYWNAKNETNVSVSSGIYFIRLFVNNKLQDIKKLTVIK